MRAVLFVVGGGFAVWALVGAFKFLVAYLGS